MKNSPNPKRYRIGILFNFSPQWMGGVFYVINIVKTLNFLEEEEKPEIILFYRSDLAKFLSEFEYPYLKLVEWSFPPKVKGILTSLLFRRNVFIDSILRDYSLDAIYPVHDFPIQSKTSVKLIAWWADLQEKHYPEFFSKKEIIGRNIRTRFILRNCNDLVVSSQDVKDDFVRFYNVDTGINIHVFHFVSILAAQEDQGIDELKEKYSLPDRYFIVSNQFHKHKNHKVLLNALSILKKRGVSTHLAVTGKLPCDTNSPYLQEIRRIIKEDKIEKQITFLGVISRSEQIQLLKHSQAVLQPSLFEGWSTVIEDAKSLQVPVIASNLSVNREQLGKDGNYFDPHNPEELASKMEYFPERDLSDIIHEDYTVRTKKAAKALLRIFK